MKYNILFLVVLLGSFTNSLFAQCPSVSTDASGGSGAVYNFDISSGTPTCGDLGAMITIGGSTYALNVCAGGIANYTLIAGAPVALPNTVNFGGAIGNCMYQMSGALLPVEFLYFRTEQGNKKILLKWATATEFKNEGFEIQHSINGQDWRKIGYEEGQGDSYQKSTYEFAHARPTLGNNYYRLKQMDHDGQFDYSTIESIQFSDGNVLPVQIFPNPVNEGKLTIKFEAFLANEIQIHLYDLTGRTWLQQTSFDAITNLNVNDLAAGIYLIEIAANGQTTRQKVVIE